MPLSELDRNLLDRCLQRKPQAWEDLVNRFLGLVMYVVNHTAQSRNISLTAEDRDDLCADVFLNLIKDDFALLRHFRGQSSLATYLVVVARRIVVKSLLGRCSVSSPEAVALEKAASDGRPTEPRITNSEEVLLILEDSPENEAKVVRMYHLDGKSYQEIIAALGVEEDNIASILSRARSKLQRAKVSQTTA